MDLGEFMNDLKIVYMGTPEFGLPALEAINSIYNVIAVVCQPDKVGNRNEVKYCPIKEYALKNNILVLQPESIKNEYKDIIKLEPDMIVTCAYGQIVPKELLDYPKMTLNNWKIDHGKTILKGWFLAKLKLQNGTAEDIKAGAGSIEEVDKGFDFEVTLNDDFSIAHDSESNTDRISIQLQGA